MTNVGTYAQVPTPVLPGPRHLRQHAHNVFLDLAHVSLDVFERSRRLVLVEVPVEVDLVAYDTDLAILLIPLVRIDPSVGRGPFASSFSRTTGGRRLG